MKISLPMLATIILIVLQLTSVINISWWLVFSPLIVVWGITVFIFSVLGLIALAYVITEAKDVRK